MEAHHPHIDIDQSTESYAGFLRKKHQLVLFRMVGNKSLCEVQDMIRSGTEISLVLSSFVSFRFESKQHSPNVDGQQSF